eukprot:6180628-Pleurochrysis_carterae.AAC.4
MYVQTLHATTRATIWLCVGVDTSHDPWCVGALPSGHGAALCAYVREQNSLPMMQLAVKGGEQYLEQRSVTQCSWWLHQPRG